MSELINNSVLRKNALKHLILELHAGKAPEEIKKRLVAMMQKVPYGEIVEVEQELISEGLKVEEVLKLCDIHTLVLDGSIDDSSAKTAPIGHPVDTFIKENLELTKTVELLESLFDLVTKSDDSSLNDSFSKIHSLFNNLNDVEKHYQRKENLLFPYLESYGISGPPKVMWGKHDETRKLLKNAMNAFNSGNTISTEEAALLIDYVLKPAAQAIIDMIFKEEQILFPMCMDRLTDVEWYEIYKQSDEIGYCLYDPIDKWTPDGISPNDILESTDSIRLPSGSFATNEILAILNTLPVDLTFVDKNDKVKYFSQGKNRIFNRNRAIINRDVRMCHPPTSVHIIERILNDFKSGKKDKAPFWINLHDKFILIEYYALRDENGEYLGTLEVSQDLTSARQLEGEQRLLSY